MGTVATVGGGLAIAAVTPAALPVPDADPITEALVRIVRAWSTTHNTKTLRRGLHGLLLRLDG